MARFGSLRPAVISTAVCALTLATAAGARAQSPTPSDAPVAATPASSWSEAVNLYAAGQYVPAVLQATQIEPGELLAQGRRDADVWRRDGSPAGRSNLRAASALALELGLLRLDSEADSANAIEVGESSLRALERDASNEGRFGAVWRLGHLQLLLFARLSDEVDARARRDDVKQLPDALQAEWHVARGIGFETAARLNAGATRLQPFGRAALSREVWVERNLRNALGHYQAALAADGTHLETRVRLGRVLLELGKPAEARPHLERAATERCLDVVCGLGWLFLGEWQMIHGTPDAARHAYVRASSVLELRQSALIGLLSATMQVRPSAAITLTRQFDAQAMLGRRHEPDAWSRYLAGHPFGLTAVVRVLREEVGK